jgi:hypothetical protein
MRLRQRLTSENENGKLKDFLGFRGEKPIEGGGGVVCPPPLLFTSQVSIVRVASRNRKQKVFPLSRGPSASKKQ